MKELLLFSILIFLCSSCYEETMGCKDPLAKSYDVSADEACEDECCDYPSLKLTISHRHGENTFSYDSVYSNKLLQPYSFKYIHLFLSNGKLIDTFGNVVAVSDFIELEDNGNSVTIIDDIISFTPSDFRFEFGTWIGAGLFKQLTFDIGIRSEVNKNTIAGVSDHLINSIGDSLCTNNTYSSAFISLDSMNIEDSGLFIMPETVPITIDIDQLINRGFDVTFELNIDYSLWFEDVDFSDLPPIDSQLSSKSINMFELR